MSLSYANKLYPLAWLMPRRPTARDEVFEKICEAVEANRGPIEIPLSRLAEAARFSYDMTALAVADLEGRGLIVRHRANPGQPYTFSLPADESS